MEVSINGGTRKSSISMGFSLINPSSRAHLWKPPYYSHRQHLVVESRSVPDRFLISCLNDPRTMTQRKFMWPGPNPIRLMSSVQKCSKSLYHSIIPYRLDDNRLGSCFSIPKVIINQQGVVSHCSNGKLTTWWRTTHDKIVVL